MDIQAKLESWSVEEWKRFFLCYPEMAERAAEANREIYYDWLDSHPIATLPPVGEIEHDVDEEPDVGE